MDSPPPQLKASGTLSEKEANEVEVISKIAERFSIYDELTRPCRASHQFILQHHPSNDD